MVGEIRDQETSEIAVQAALTGHLVLSTLHTNDAPTAIPRFLDLGIQPFLLAATLNIVIAQRLIRHVCPDCIYSKAPSPAEMEAVKMQATKMKLPDTFAAPKFTYGGKGCQACGGTGYRGRGGIYEIIEVDEDLRREILKGQFSIDDAYAIMRKKGTRSMFEDGMLKAAQGITTIEEVLRVVGE
jgi:type II secretory ATPase GspE/PulE/Tfp pilus assembly ATPase PilB-like protein